MQNTTQLYKDLLAAYHSTERKLEVYDKDGMELVHTFTKEEIVSMYTSRSLFPDSNPSVGGTVSSEIDCELYIGDVAIPRMAMLKPYVRLSAIQYKHGWGKYNISTGKGDVGTITISYIFSFDPVYVSETVTYSQGKVVQVSAEELEVMGASLDEIRNAVVGKWVYIRTSVPFLDFIVFIENEEDVQEYHTGGGSRDDGFTFTGAKAIPVRGSYVEDVVDDDKDAYPNDGIFGNFWYVYTGETQEHIYSEWLPKGVYWIDTRSTDYSSNKMTIHGYDAMLKGEVMFATETTVEDWPRTDLQVLNGYYSGTTLVHDGIAQKLGVTIQADSLDLIDQGYEIQFPGTVQGDDENVQGAAYTVRECLSYIMAMYGLNATIDEMEDEDTGLPVMRFIPLTTQTVKTTLSQNVMSFDTIPAFEAFGQVEVIVNENESVIYPTTGSGRKLTVTSPWGVQDSNVAQNIYNIVHGYAYQPFNADGAILDPAAQLGDGVSVNGVTSVLNAIGTRFSSLCSANISAPQDEEIDHEYPYESKENREITRSIASTRARLTVLTDSITAEVTRATEAEGTLSASIALTAESITSEVTRATAAEGELSSRITQTAMEVSSKVSKGSIISEINQSAEEIKISADKLTLTGLVTISALGTEGSVTINGGNITADTINANRIVASSWGGLNIGGTGGYLNNSYINTAYIRTLGLPSAGSSTLNVRLSSSGVSTDGGSTYTDWDTIKAGGTGTAVFG